MAEHYALTLLSSRDSGSSWDIPAASAVRSDPRRRFPDSPATIRDVKVRFLGTGASGSTPGRGRSGRRESSLLISDGTELLIDLTRDFAAQAEHLVQIDAILLTHGIAMRSVACPRSAAGGCSTTAPGRLTSSSAERPLRSSERVYKRLEHCRLHVVAPGQSRRVGSLDVSATGRSARARASFHDVRVAGHVGHAVGRVRLRRRLPHWGPGTVLCRSDGLDSGRSDVAQAAVLPSHYRRGAPDSLRLIGRVDHAHSDRPPRPAPPAAPTRGRRSLSQALAAHDGLIVTI